MKPIVENAFWEGFVDAITLVAMILFIFCELKYLGVFQ